MKVERLRPSPRRAMARVALASLMVVPLFVISPASASAGGVVSGLDHEASFLKAAYVDFMGRPPTNPEYAAPSLDNPAKRAVWLGDFATSTEWTTATVQQLYQNTLGRPGDSGGVAYWANMVRQGRLSVAQVAASLYSSSEYFKGFGQSDVHTWVLDLYRKVLERDGTADPSGVAYWAMLAQRIGRTGVAYAFFQSAESCRTRVQNLYLILLGRLPDAAGSAYWARIVKTAGDVQLAVALAASDEYYERAYRRYGRPSSDDPNQPTAVVATAGNGRATVSWTASTSAGNDAFLASLTYTVTATPGGQTCTTTGARPLNCTVTGLTNGTTYTFAVTASNTHGTGLPSLPSAPVTPLNRLVAPTNVTAMKRYSTMIINWDAPYADGGSPITGYTATSDPAGGSCTTTGSTGCTITGLVVGVDYTFTVTASNADGVGPPSLPSAPNDLALPPGPPSAVAATPGDGSATVSWTAPADDGGSPVIQYRICAVPAPVPCELTTATSISMSGLTNGSSYTFTVTAKNKIGLGSTAASAVPVVPMAP